VKTLNPLKAPFGKGKFSPIRNVRYLQWEDAFEVDFDDGLSFLEPHNSIRAANGIAKSAKVKSVALEDELRSGFFVQLRQGSDRGSFLVFHPRAAAPKWLALNRNVLEGVAKLEASFPRF
jgi:hypothetical protein